MGNLKFDRTQVLWHNQPHQSSPRRKPDHNSGSNWQLPDQTYQENTAEPVFEMARNLWLAQPVFQPSEPGPHGLSSFTRFPDFPLEIRQLIWDACITPRLVVNTRPRLSRLRYAVVRSQARPPVISQVCSEARSVALRNAFQITITECGQGRKSYNVCPAVNFRLLAPRWQKGSDGAYLNHYVVWFNPKKDTIWLSRWADTVSESSQTEVGLYFALLKRFLLDKIGTKSVHLAVSPNPTKYHFPSESWTDFKNLNLPPSPPLTYARAPDQLLLVVHNYTVRATRSAALESGLFGLWCENRAIMVEVDNRKTICDMLDLDTWEPVSPQHASIAGTKTAETILREAQLEAFLRSDEHEDEDAEDQDEEGHNDEHWHGWHWKRKTHFMTREKKSRKEQKWAQDQSFFDGEHPRAKKILSDMPQMKPVIMFDLVRTDEPPKFSLEQGTCEAMLSALHI